MADRDQMIKALRNAHNAGDDAAARRIAQMIKASRASAEKPADDAGFLGSAGDIAKSLGSGVVRGVAAIPDMPSMVGGLLASGVEKGYKALSGEPIPQAFSEGMRGAIGVGPVDLTRPYATEAVTQVAPDVMGYEPQTTAGEYAQTIGSFLPGAAGGGARAAASMVAAGAASEAAGQALEGTAYEPYARIIAAIAAPTAGAAALRRIVSPFGGVPSVARLEMAKVLDDAGVPITAGQRTGSETLRRIEGKSGSASRIAGEQASAFTRAALKTIGENADAATPEVLQRAATRIGGVFDDAVSGVQLTPTAANLTKASDALQAYRAMKPTAEAAPIFTNINKELLRAAQSGAPIEAKNAKAWRSILSKMTRSADPATREAAVGMLDVIDDAFSDALRAAGKPEMVSRLAEARAQYRNLLAIEVAASRAGEATAQGILSPSQLRNAVVMQGRRAFTHGKRGGIGDLTRAAEAVIKPLPTTEAGGLRDMRGMAEVLGGGAGAAAFGPIGAMAGVAAPTIAREAVGLTALQRYLANQLMSGRGGYAQAGARTLPGLLSSGE